MRRVVITGLGIVSCIGNNQSEVLDSLLNTKSGIEGIKFYGSLDLKNVRCSFFSIAFVFNEVFVELKMIYDKEDRYGKKIEDRILDSLEIIEEL